MLRTFRVSICLALVACGAPAAAVPDAPATPVVVDPSPEPSAVLGAAAAPPGPRIAVPAGTVLAGSRPGTVGRRPHREADLVPVEVPAFEIDRRPLVDARGIPLVARSVAEATTACESRGARLCDELEWERACEGDEHFAFPTGAEMDLEACTMDLGSCTTPFGVVAPGVEEAEWTASSIDPVRAGAAPEATVVVRGSRFDGPLPSHRCDARAALAPVSDIGAAVRCCHGPAPALAYPELGTHAMFRDAPELGSAELRTILATIPELEPYAADFVLHGTEDGLRALGRGDATVASLAGWELASGAFRWSPSGGDELLVFSGHGGGSSILVALYPVFGGGYVHGASFVLRGEDAPFAVSRTPPSRAELHWTACFGCGGEGGLVRIDEDSVVRMTQF